MSKFPAIEYWLRASTGKCPSVVADWIDWSEAELPDGRHAIHLEAALTWAANIHRFPSVAKALRRDNAFWEAYAQVRIAWWLAKLGIHIAEFEPSTVGAKRADIRCSLGASILDVEVTSPTQSSLRRKTLDDPYSYLVSALQAHRIPHANVRIDRLPNASLERLNDSAAWEIASAIATSIESESLDVGDTRVLEFANVLQVDLDTKNLLGPLKIVLTGTAEEFGHIGRSVDPMRTLKPTRKARLACDPPVDWITHTLLSKAEQLTREHVNVILFETTRDDELFARHRDPTPWGIDTLVSRIWSDKRFDHIAFVGLFSVAPGCEIPLPGTLIPTPSLWLNPRYLASSEGIDEFRSVWRRWVDLVQPPIE